MSKKEKKEESKKVEEPKKIEKIVLRTITKDDMRHIQALDTRDRDKRKED
jgi:hypothetical protein